MEILHMVGLALLLLGALFVFTGSVGLLRLPEAITRIHAAGVADVFGACLMLLGLAALSESWNAVAKLLILVVLLMVTSPAACHALVQAAFAIPAIKRRWQRMANAPKGKK